MSFGKKTTFRDDDATFIWGLSGWISTLIFADGYSVFLKWARFEPQYSWNYAADYIIQGRHDIESLLGVIIGLTADFFIGSMNGFLIGLVLEWRGTAFYWLKGIGIGLSNWFMLGAMTQVYPQLFTYKLTPLNYVTYIFSYCGFGALTAFLIVKWTKYKKSE